MRHFFKINIFLFIIFIIVLAYFFLNKDYKKIIYLGYTIGSFYFLLIFMFLIDILYNNFKIRKKYITAKIINLKEAKETNLNQNEFVTEIYIYNVDII